MLGLRRRGQVEARRAWQSVDPGDLDGSFPLGQLELSVSTLQREAARLSSGYLSAFISSELGEPATPPPVTVWNRAWGGGDLRTGLRSAIVRTKMAIADGTEPREAVRVNRATLVNDVGLFIDTAARESLRAGMEADERVVGYQRALKGTCGACLGNVGVETSVELPSIPLMVHPNCQCVTEPVVTRKAGSKIPPLRVLQKASSRARPGEFEYAKRYHGTPNATFGSKADDVLEQLSGRHKWPATQPIPLRPIGGAKNGQFVYRQMSRTPVEIRVPQSLPADEIGSAIAEETGHFLDLLLGPVRQTSGIGEVRSFLSQSVPARGGTELQKAMRGFLNAAKKSPTLRNMPRNHAHYLGQDHEIWARAYSQWITGQGPKPDAKTWGDVYKWPASEWKPISRALEKVLKAAGLL